MPVGKAAAAQHGLTQIYIYNIYIYLYIPPWRATSHMVDRSPSRITDNRRDCIERERERGSANHRNINNNLVCVVKAYTTLGVAIGVVSFSFIFFLFGVVRGWFFGFSNNTAYITALDREGQRDRESPFGTSFLFSSLFSFLFYFCFFFSSFSSV